MSVSACRTLAESEYFQGFIMGVIVLTAVLTGLETSAPVQAAYGQVLHTLNIVIQAIFVCELGVRLLAHGKRWDMFFRDGWNLFDFIIVAASLLPQVGAFTTVARLARLLRVARLLSVSPELRLIVTTMLHSIPRWATSLYCCRCYSTCTALSAITSSTSMTLHPGARSGDRC